MNPKAFKEHSMYQDKSWFVLRTVELFKEVVSKHMKDVRVISVAHDLTKEHINKRQQLASIYSIPQQTRKIILTNFYNEMETATGYEAVKWLQNQYMVRSYPLPVIRVHEVNNAIGVRCILDAMDQHDLHLKEFAI